MIDDTLVERPLYGGAAQIGLPQRFADISDFRPVPDHQEVRWAAWLAATQTQPGSCRRSFVFNSIYPGLILALSVPSFFCGILPAGATPVGAESSSAYVQRAS